MAQAEDIESSSRHGNLSLGTSPQMEESHSPQHDQTMGRSASIQAWSQTVSRRGSAMDLYPETPDPVMLAYVQAKLALFDRMLYINVNGS